MKLISIGIGILIIALLGAFLYEHQKNTELALKIMVLGDERDAMNRQLRKLDQHVTELRSRAAVTRPATDAPPTASVANAAAAPAAPSQPVARPGVTVTAPPGWAKNGSKPASYVVGVDELQTWGGMPSAYVESLERSVDGFGGMMQTAAADTYIGKRIRLSGWIKTEDAAEGGQLWLRVDGQERGKSLQFDNMNDRAVKGTADWQEASIVLDVPPGASALAYGFFVKGAGKMWVNGTRIEEVGAEIPTTNMLSQRPVNLGFKPDKPKS